MRLPIKYEKGHLSLYSPFFNEQYLFSNKVIIEVFSLPCSFWGNVETVENVHGDVKIQYVTDKHGQNYCIHIRE